LLFDVSDRSSYENVRKWMMQIDEHASASTTKILIGNKADCEESARRVSKEEGEELASSFGIQYFEASAKAGLNISESLENIIRQVIINLKQNPSFYALDVVKLDERTDSNTNANRGVPNAGGTKKGACPC
jgi:GTPase SAR1 family protein